MDITLDDKLGAFQQISQRKLIEILDGIAGKKDLIIEQKLMKLLDCFVGVTVLRRYGVEKIFKMEQGLKPANAQRIFISSCDLIACKRVLDQIQAERSNSPGLSHHVLVVPLVPIALRSLVEEEGLAGLIELRSLSWEFILFDGNFLSMEIPFFSDLYYYKDTGLLPALSRNLWSLKLILGAPRLTLAFGKHSQQTLKMVKTIEESFGAPSTEQEIGALILMDRSFDLASTLLTSVTYLGLLSEVVDINIGTASLGSAQTKLDPNKDQVYGEVRDKHFSDAFPTLRNKAKLLKNEQESTQGMKLAEMKHYVATTLKKTTEVKQQLEFHITACEAAISALGSEFENLHSIEESILECTRRKECLEYIERNIDDHPLRSLRLLALLSITSDGVTRSETQTIQQAHLHAHGYQNIPLFHKLEKVNLLKYRTDNVLNKLPNWTSKWIMNAKKLKLIPSASKNVDLKGPTCPSYVFSGVYIPAIAQIINTVANQTDAKSLEELTNLPECIVTGTQGTITPKTIVVCIIGGITYAEISACRLIEKSAGIRLVLVSDSSITGNKLIETVQNS